MTGVPFFLKTQQYMEDDAQTLVGMNKNVEVFKGIFLIWVCLCCFTHKKEREDLKLLRQQLSM